MILLIIYAHYLTIQNKIDCKDNILNRNVFTGNF